MASLVGLAFTSPAIAVMVIDRALFRVHFYQNRPGDLHAFLQEADERLPVVLLESLTDLQRVYDVEGVHAFLLSEDPRVLAYIPGAVMLDAEEDNKFSGFKKIMIRPDVLNAALLKQRTFSLPTDRAAALASLRGDISFRELLATVVADRKLDKDFVPNVCRYLVGALPRRSWVSRVQRPGLALGIPVERMAELEKYLETAPSAEMVWRAYYDHAEAGVPLASAAAQFEADEADVAYVVSQIGNDKGTKYVRSPHDKPLVFQRKRKVRKLSRMEPQGSSMAISVKQVESQMSDESAEVFNLDAVLGRIDSDSEDHDFSRAACAFVCGLMPKDDFITARKAAMKKGAKKDDIREVLEFAQSADSLWKAYCYYSFYIGITPSDAASKFSAPVSHLQTVLKYKPMAFVFQFVKWPEELS